MSTLGEVAAGGGGWHRNQEGLLDSLVEHVKRCLIFASQLLAVGLGRHWRLGTVKMSQERDCVHDNDGG